MTERSGPLPSPWLLLPLVLLTACAREAPRPDMVLITIDTLRPDALGATELQRIAGLLGLDADGYERQGESLVILRHTLMNPYLIDAENGISYIDGYFDFLGERVRDLLAESARPA